MRWGTTVLLCILLATYVQAYSASSDNFSSQTVVDSGGGKTNSSTYDTIIALGQSIIGNTEADNYSTSLGFFNTAVTSAANKAPGQPTIDLTPDSPTVSDDLVCTITVNSTDSDGDSVNYTFEWFQDSVWFKTTEYTLNTSDTLDSTNTAKNEQWECRVTPWDGTVNGSYASDTVTIANSAPSQPTVDLTPDKPSTTTDLNCTITGGSTDSDGDTINYTFIFYQNNVINYTFGFTEQTYYSLGGLNTTAADLWNCTVLASDGTQNSTAGADNVTINSPPSIVNLSTPSNDSTITNRTPTFNWTEATDDDGDTITYYLTIQRESCSQLQYCDTSIINVTDIATNQYTVTQPLDVDATYNWTVIANDSVELGTWSGWFNTSVQSLNSITIVNATINFSAVNLLDYDNTSDNDPNPFLIENDGNIFTNLTIYASEGIWDAENAKLNTSYFRSKAGNSSELQSFNWTSSQITFTNITDYQLSIVDRLNFSDLTDSAEIDIYIEAPPGEPSGQKTADIVITSVIS